MSDVIWQTGQRVKVAYTIDQPHGVRTEREYVGTVLSHKKGWVMLTLDTPATTTAGVETSQMFARESDVSPLDS